MSTSSASVMTPVVVDAELELRVGEDEAAVLGRARRALVDLEREVAQLLGALRADELDGLVERDVLVVLAHRRLVGRGEDRRGQAVAVLEAGGQPDAAHRAVSRRTPPSPSR